MSVIGRGESWGDERVKMWTYGCGRVQIRVRGCPEWKSCRFCDPSCRIRYSCQQQDMQREAYNR